MCGKRCKRIAARNWKKSNQNKIMAKRKHKKNPALRWGLSLLAAAGGFQVGAFFGNLFAALLSAGVAFYLVWTALR
mgnify:FL=1